MKSDATTINYARVFHLLREQGASTRAQLARDTGLSPASITTITRDMIQRGYVREAGAASSDSGRPPIILEYNSRARYALGIDVHADGIFGVVTDLYARPFHSERLELPRPKPEAMIEALGGWIERTLAAQQPQVCAAVGIAMSALVDQERGVVLSSPDFGLAHLPLAERLEERTGFLPALTNLTRAAALAERWLGAAGTADNMVYLRLGRTIGGAIIVEGQPYWGSGHAPSMAHLNVDPNGRSCRCGSRGCLDTVASGAAVVRSAQELIAGGRASSLVARVDGALELITADLIQEEAAAGDTLAGEALQEAARWLGIGVATCINLLGPDMVVLGGTLGRGASELFLDTLRKTARARAEAAAVRDVRIVTTTLGEEGGAAGAAAIAIFDNLVHSIDLHLG